MRFNQPAGDNGANQIDLWYRGGDTFRVSVIDPAGNTVGPVNVGTATNFTLPGGNTVRIDHRNNDAVQRRPPRLHDVRAGQRWARCARATGRSV